MSATWDSKGLKATPITADEILIIDTADGRNQKRSTLGSFGAAIWSKSGSNIFPSTLTDKVGIGINTPIVPLHIRSLAVTGAITVDGDSDDFFIENKGNVGYTVAPTVVIASPPTPVTTAGTAVLDTGIKQVNVTAGGTGYTSPPAVVFTGGTPSTVATATAVLTANAVTSVTITNKGAGYSSTPTVSFTGGGGSGATGTAVTTQFVTSITITNKGSGYISAPTVTIDAATGTNPITALATAILVNTEVTTINITNQGQDYLSVPSVAFTAAPSAVTATATANISGGKVVSTTITNGGVGYKIPPSVVTFSGGDGNGVGVDTVTVANSSITSITVTAGGAGLTVISDPGQVGVLAFTTGGATTTTEKILFDHSTERMRFIVDSVQGLIIDSVGHVAVSQDNEDHPEVFTVDTDILNVPSRLLIRDSLDRLMLGYNGSDNFVTNAIQAQVIVQTDTGDLSIASRGNAASQLKFFTSEGSNLVQRLVINSIGNMTFGLESNPTMHININNNNVGINTSSGTQSLTVNGSFSASEASGFFNSLFVGSNFTVDSNTFHVDATNNRVGVGISSPTTILHVASALPDTTSILTTQSTGTNPGITKTFVGNRDPNGNITGAGGDEYIRDSAGTSATYESKETTTGTNWLRRNLYLNKDFEINTQADYDALFSDGVIDVTSAIGGTNSGYTNGESITLSGGSGTGAAATAVITGGVIQSITFTNRGTGYAAANVLTITGVTSTTSTATITITSINDNVKANTEGTTIFFNLQVTGTGRFVLYDGKDLTLAGRNVSEAGMTYTGTGTFISGKGQLQVFDAVDLNGGTTVPGGGTFLDNDGNMLIDNVTLRRWTSLGTLRNGAFIFRHIDAVDLVQGFTVIDPSTTLMHAIEFFGSTFNGSMLTYSNKSRIGSNANFSDLRARIFGDNGTFFNLALTSVRSTPFTITNVQLTNGNLFKETTVANSIVTAVADSPLTAGTITTTANNNSGGTTVNGNRAYFNGEEVTITGSSVADYNGTHFVFNVSGNSFDIPITFNGTATGTSNTVRLLVTCSAVHGLSVEAGLKFIKTNFYNGFMVALDLPTTSTIIVNGTFVSTNTGEIEKNVGLDQSDGRVITTNNFTFPNSTNIAGAFVNNNSTVNGTIVNNTFTDMVFGTVGDGLVAVSTMELWRLTDELNGTFEYVGLDEFDGLITFDFTEISAGGTVEFRFKWQRDAGAGFVDLDDPVESLVAVGSDAQSVSKTFPLIVNTGDKIKPQITRNSGSSGITTSYATILAIG